MFFHRTREELLRHAEKLTNLTLGQLADALNIPMAPNLKRKKGWAGQLLEQALGAHAGNQALPDFPELGVELKTIPVKPNGQPKESTFICVAHLTHFVGVTWAESLVKRKLDCVLWVPISTEPECLAERRIGQPFLWKPSATWRQILAADYALLSDKIALGQIDQIGPKDGQYLQIRPKAANARQLCRVFNEEGELTWTLPRGFYLRALATSKILGEQSLIIYN